MTLTPPFTLTGEAGKALGAVGYSLAALGVQDAVLSLRSLDVDTLTFTLRDNGARPAIPDDGQWLTLKDDAGQVLFTGIAKRSFRFPERIYTYEVSNVYQGMMETNLLSNGRPFITYFADDAARILTDLLSRAADVGLAVQTGAMPELFTVPKMSFRASSYAGAIEDALKWLPDVTSRMDYSTTPPTLLFQTRASAPGKVIDLDGESHKATALELTPYPEMRALGITFNFARRVGDEINQLSQFAGDVSAEGVRQRSIFISGAERMDAFVAEALMAAKDAAAAAVSAGGVLPDNTPSLIPDWDFCLANDFYLPLAVAQQPAFKMRVAYPTRTLYNGEIYEFDDTPRSFTEENFDYSRLSLKLDVGGADAVGWFAVKDGWFTDEDLASVGISKRTCWFDGHLFWDSLNDNGGSLISAGADYLELVDHRRSYANSSSGAMRALWYRSLFDVTAINAPPSLVESLITANNGGYSIKFIRRAEYVDVPPDLAANYFARQDWTPYKGSLTLAPSAVDFPAPGDFLSITGTGTPTEWATMKCPVAELALDLRTGAATVAIGPSPRMDFSSLVDRLRIPPEDNYQAG